MEESYDPKYFTSNLKHVLDRLSFWPEIGFYEPVSINKYLVGVIVPKKYMKNRNLTIIINKLAIRIL